MGDFIIFTPVFRTMKNLISFLLRRVPRKYLQTASRLGRKVLPILYKGNNVECTVCGGTFRKFLPFGRLEPRENALCPSCLSLERHRLMWTFLKEKTDFFSAKLRLLHVAPEICFIHRFEALPNLDYITADLESPWAKVHMDVHDIPFPENEFDVVFCNHVLEHVESDLRVLQEFYRVLKPGGWAILQSPIDLKLATTDEDPTVTDPAEREKRFGQDDHLRMFGRDYGDRLRQGGFEVEELDLVHEFSPEDRKRYGFDETEILYVCKKKKV